MDQMAACRQQSAANAARSGRATLIGFIAILLWSCLALLTTWTGAVPPFQLTAMSFLIAFATSSAVIGIRTRGSFRSFRLPLKAWAVGVGGLFGFHCLYFLALRHAPAAHASLIAYLWPLLIVVLASYALGDRLRWFQVVGCVCGFAGAALLVLRGNEFGLQGRYLAGYLAALACAFTWSSYSVISRTLRRVPSDAVAAFCGATAVLALGCHLVLETTVWPGTAEWLAVIALGLGPVGGAFFAWDYGIKWGNVKALGGGSYLAPLLSTTLLVAAGSAAFTWSLVSSCILIVGGAVLCSTDLFQGKSQASPSGPPGDDAVQEELSPSAGTRVTVTVSCPKRI